MIAPCSLLDINCLKGALLTNENGYSFYCGGIGFSLDDKNIWIDLLDSDTLEHHSSVQFNNLTNWSIQFNSNKPSPCPDRHYSAEHD